MMRYMAIEAIERDPAWNNGEYKTEPVQGLRNAAEMLFIMGSSPLQMQKNFPTREAAEQRVDAALDRAVANTDANDLIYYVNASRDYDPSAKPGDASRRRCCGSTPPTTSSTRRSWASPRSWSPECRTPRSSSFPISDATRGHGTHTQAAVWKSDLADFMARTERK